jgi:hypothetical protein
LISYKQNGSVVHRDELQLLSLAREGILPSSFYVSEDQVVQHSRFSVIGGYAIINRATYLGEEVAIKSLQYKDDIDETKYRQVSILHDAISILI